MNYNTPATTHLTDSERKLAMEAIDSVAPGRYTAKQLLGTAWSTLQRPRRFGKCFKASAIAGELPGLRWVGRRSNKSLLYEVAIRPEVRTQRLKGGMMAVRGFLPRATDLPLLQV